MAYAVIRREVARRGIMNHVSSLGRGPSEIDSGLTTHRSDKPSFRREDRTNLRCSHCSSKGHTKDGCFKLIGYPDWWEDLQKKKATTKAPASRIGGKALLAAIDPTGGSDEGGVCMEISETGKPRENHGCHGDLRNGA